MQILHAGNRPDGALLTEGTDEGWTLTDGTDEGWTLTEGTEDGATLTEGLSLGVLDGSMLTDGVELGLSLGPDEILGGAVMTFDAGVGRGVTIGWPLPTHSHASKTFVPGVVVFVPGIWLQTACEKNSPVDPSN